MKLSDNCSNLSVLMNLISSYFQLNVVSSVYLLSLCLTCNVSIPVAAVVGMKCSTML